MRLPLSIIVLILLTVFTTSDVLAQTVTTSESSSTADSSAATEAATAQILEEKRQSYVSKMGESIKKEVGAAKDGIKASSCLDIDFSLDLDLSLPSIGDLWDMLKSIPCDAVESVYGSAEKSAASLVEGISGGLIDVNTRDNSFGAKPDNAMPSSAARLNGTMDYMSGSGAKYAGRSIVPSQNDLNLGTPYEAQVDDYIGDLQK